MDQDWSFSLSDFPYLFHFFIYLFWLFQFFTDPCASSPCLHGNCSQSNSGEEEVEPTYTCECTEGYEGEKCDQIPSDLPPTEWDTASPGIPELATPATSTTAAATQPPAPTTILSTTTPSTPTLQPWQPKPGQRLLVVPWEADRVRQTARAWVNVVFLMEIAYFMCVCVSGDRRPALWRPAVWTDFRNPDFISGGAWGDSCKVRPRNIEVHPKWWFYRNLFNNKLMGNCVSFATNIVI